MFHWLLDIIESVKALYNHHLIFSVGVLLFTGYFFGKTANRIGLPSITGYILAGLLLGESLIGIIHYENAPQLHIITEVALGIIALTIGSEFEFSRLRRTGVRIIVLTLFEATFAFIFVYVGLTLAGLETSYALLLGAISTATAPAATVIIVRELRARGEFIDYLYGVVAFDDSVCVIFFSIVFALVAPLLASAAAVQSSLLSGILNAAGEIGLSSLIGFGAGIILHLIIRKKRIMNEILIISLAVIFLTISITVAMHLSLLIANMVTGATLVNLSRKNHRVFTIIEPITPPIFALFFILAGTELHLNVFTKSIVILYGLIYLVSRFLGKYSGIFTASTLLRCSSRIRTYLGFCLFPQAGVAIGLVLFVQTSPVLKTAPQAVTDMLILIVNIVLFSIFINELIGPIISKFGVKRGTDI